MSITLNKNRVGNFTSSEIYKLIGNGKREMTAAELAARPKSGVGSATKFIEAPEILSDPALTYIQEKRYERKLKRSIDVEKMSRPASWGLLMEPFVDLLICDITYRLNSQETTLHKWHDYVASSADFIGENIVGSLKCYEPKKFCEFAEALQKKDPAYIRDNYPQEYWQLINDAFVNECEFGEFLLFMPYEDQLNDVRDLAAERVAKNDEQQYRWIIDAPKQCLPYLPRDSEFESLNRFKFEIPIQDFRLLEIKIKKGGAILLS